MQHSTGLYKKIAKLNNPEEIEKWREERRKKYPTKSNIEKKNFEIQEKIERGEKMDIKYSKKIGNIFSLLYYHVSFSLDLVLLGGHRKQITSL